MIRKEEGRECTILSQVIRKSWTPSENWLTAVLYWKRDKSVPGSEPSLSRQNAIALPLVPPPPLPRRPAAILLHPRTNSRGTHGEWDVLEGDDDFDTKLCFSTTAGKKVFEFRNPKKRCEIFFRISCLPRIWNPKLENYNLNLTWDVPWRIECRGFLFESRLASFEVFETILEDLINQNERELSICFFLSWNARKNLIDKANF